MSPPYVTCAAFSLSPERDDGPVSEEIAEELSPAQEAKLRILDKLERADRWGGNTVSWDTLRNHYCRGVEALEEGLKALIDEDLVVVAERGTARKGPFSLNPGEKGSDRTANGSVPKVNAESDVSPNNCMQWTALRAAADAERVPGMARNYVGASPTARFRRAEG